jgi:hypothetical protein
MEEWKPVKGFETKYMISNLGRVKSLSTNVILSPADNGNGYMRVNLYGSGKHHTKYIHVLMVEAFIPNPDNLTEVNHKDENKANNTLSNLEWCTHVYNCNYGTRVERTREKKSKPIAQYKLTGELVKVWNNIAEIRQAFNCSRSSIYNCLSGISKSSHGYKWSFDY